MKPDRTETTTTPSPTGELASSTSGAASRIAVERLDLLCDQLIHRWRREDMVPVEQFLAAHPEIEPGSEDEFDLIFVEYLLGEESGQGPTLEGYLDRFPRQADRLRRQLALHDLLEEDNLDTEGDSAADHEAAPVAPAHWWPAPEGYRIERLLGRGGMGVVYQARQVQLNRVVALKMIRSGAYASSEDASRFRAEAEVIAQFQHPHIVQIHAMGDHDGQPFFEMEYVDGGSLADRLEGTPRPVREAAALVEVVARTMHEAHRRGIVHRDLKPANILLTTQGTPKIADFGLAKLLDVDSGLTRTDSALGSPGYMAPEQAGGARGVIGPAADVYAMGVILYELMTGRPPFAAPSVLETLDLVRHAEPVPPSRLRPGLPRDAETITLRCLAKEPACRYSSAEGLADDLARFLTGRAILARPVGPLEQAWHWTRRNAVLAGLIAAVTASLVGGFAGMAVLWLRAVREARNTQIQINLTNQARRAEQTSRAEVDRISAGLTLDRGQMLAEGGQVARGLHFMEESLRIDPEDRAGLNRAVRRNLSAWAGQIPRLVAASDMPEGVRSGQFSPDGRFYAVATQAGLIRIWELDALRSVDSIGAHASPATKVAFRPDGNVLASCGEDGTVRLWDPVTGRPIASPLVHPTGISELNWNNDGRLLATATGALLRVWDMSRTDQPPGLIDCGATITQIVLLPDQPIALIGTQYGEIQRWNLATGSRVGPPLVFVEWLNKVVLSPDGSRFVVGLGRSRQEGNSSVPRGSAKIYETATCRLIGSIADLNAGVDHIRFRADGRTFLTGDNSGTTRQWDRDGRSLGLSIKSEVALVRSAFSPDGRYVLIGSVTGQARLWDLDQTQPISAVLEKQGEVSVSFHRDGRSIVVADARKVAIYDAALEGYPPPMLHRMVDAFAFRDDRSVFTCGRDNTARLWDVATAQPLAAAMIHEGFVHCVDFLPGGTMVATGGRDQTVRLWDGEGKPIGLPIRTPHWVFAVKLVDKGQKVIVGSADNTARLFDVVNRKWVGTPIRHRGDDPGRIVDSLAVLPDGNTAVSVSNDGTVARMDLRSGQQVGDLIDYSQRLHDIDFNRDKSRLIVLSGGVVHVINTIEGRLVRSIGQSLNAGDFFPDGRTILTGGDDRFARCWDIETGQPVGPPFDVGKAVVSVSVGPDGELALIVTSDGQARFWDLATGRPIGPSRPCLVPAPKSKPEFAPNGRSVAVSHNSLEIWDVPEVQAVAHDQVRDVSLAKTRINADDWVGSDSPTWHNTRPGPAMGRDDDQHEREANACLLRNNPVGAFWHLDRVTSERSREWSHHARRAQAALLLNSDAMIATELVEVHRLASPQQALAWTANFAADATRAGRWDLAVAELNRYLAQRPDDLIQTAERGWARARVGDWAGARADVERAYRNRSPDLNHLFRRALLDRMAGDLAGYHAICELFRTRRSTMKPAPSRDVDHFVNWLFVVCPGAIASYDAPLRWLGPNADPLDGGQTRHDPIGFGALLYRADRLGEAIPFLDRFEQMARPDVAARSWPFLAMAHARLGRPEEARRWLDRLRAECIESGRSPGRFWDDLDLRILLEEAEAVVLDAAWPSDPFTP